MADSMSRSSVVQRNAERTHAELLDAAVRVAERGDEPTMRAVAAEAGVGERTIYRYFENREVLHDAFTAHVSPRLGTPLCDSVDGLDQYIVDLFDVFEQNRELTVAVVTSPWSQPDLSRSRTGNLRALTALLRAAFPNVDGAALGAAAASLRTAVSGAGWVYQRQSCALPADAVTDNARWLLHTVLDHLGALERAHETS